MENLGNLLIDHPFADGRDLLCTIDAVRSAGEARAAARAGAEKLRAAGVEPGQGVAVRLPSGPDLVTTMAGIWLAGAVFVPVNDRSPQAEVDHVLETVRPAALLDERGLSTLADPMRHDPDVAFVTWTSGTTGTPKAILQTHSGYLELLDRVLTPLRGAGGKPKAAREPTPNLVPVSIALNAGIYNVCFGLRGGRRDRPHAAVHHPRVRRARAALPDPLDRVAAGGHGDAGDGSRRDRPGPVALCPQHHRAAVTARRAPLHGALRHRRAEQLRAGRGR